MNESDEGVEDATRGEPNQRLTGAPRDSAQQSLAGVSQACGSMVRLRTSCHPSGPFASPGGEPRRMTGRRSLPKPESKQAKASSDKAARDHNKQNRNQRRPKPPGGGAPED